MIFTVRIAEVHYSYRDVEAKTWREAVEKAQDGDYLNEYVEYSHTHDSAPIDIICADTPDSSDNATDDYMQESDSEKDKDRSS
jgi:hypothetical protein